MDKPALIQHFVGLLEARLAQLEASLDDARAGMRVDGCFRPENRGERAAVTSQGYLAAGLNRRVTGIREALELLAMVDPGPRELVSPGALLLLADDQGAERRYLLLPGGQGDRVPDPEGEVTVISPSAPLALALRGLGEGEEGTVLREGTTARLEILEIR